MTRSQNVQLNASIENRIEEAFWQLLENSAPERISVVALSKAAHCNRGTFYYYYTDIYDLMDRLIEKYQPTSLPYHLLAYVSGQTNDEAMRRALAAEDEKLQKLGRLLLKSESNYCAEHIKNSAITVWCQMIDTVPEALDKSDYLLFEFVTSGILGMLGYISKNNEEVRAIDIMDALLPEIPQALIARIKRKHG